MGASNIEIKRCDKCGGNGTCETYCEYKAGRNIIEYLLSSEKIETDIGDIRKPTRKGGDSYIVTGHQVQHGEDKNPTYLLSLIGSNTGMSVSSKFSLKGSKNITKVIGTYTETLDQTQYREDIVNVNNIIRSINNNQIVLKPLDTKSIVRADIDDYRGGKREIETQIKGLSWKIDPETGKVVGSFIVRVESPMGFKMIHLNFEDYGSDIQLSNVAINIAKADLEANYIRMTNEGMVRPIVIDGDVKVAVDFKYIYHLKDGRADIIGEWVTDRILIRSTDDRIKKSRTIKKLNKLEKYIAIHRKNIAPLGIIEENIVEIK